MTTPSDLSRFAFLGALAFGALGVHACAPAAAPPPVAPTPPPEPERTAWPEPAPVESSESIVRAQFETSAQAIEPGATFLLAVRFQIPSDYRISWSNPGDVGRSTKVVFEVPEGFVVGPLQFPAPTRFQLPGRLVNYGYSGETAVFAEVTAPARLSEKQVFRFEVKADWLACNDECADEELGAWFELVSARKAPETQLPEELAAPYSAIPKAFTDLPESSHDWKVSRGKPALTLTAADVKWVDFFPADPEQPKLLGMDHKGDALHLKFANSAAAGPLRGVAVGEFEGKQAFFDVNLPWPER